MTQNPWDIPPRPPNGDDKDDTLYASVGRALTQWEILETRLAWLYAAVLNVRGWPVPAERAFGSIATSRARIDMLGEAAKALFFEWKDEKLEERLKKLLGRIGDYGTRRNEIAHGIVMPYRDAIAPADGYGRGFVLAPPRYSARKQELAHHSNLVPRYIYSSGEIDSFRKRFTELVTHVEVARDDVMILTKQLRRT